MLCIKMGNRAYSLLRSGIELVRFCGLCDSNKIVRKKIFFGFYVEISSFFSQKFRARSLIGKTKGYLRVDCSMKVF